MSFHLSAVDFVGLVGAPSDAFANSRPDDDEDIEQIEANGRNNEQFHGGDVRCMVAQEGEPPLGRRSKCGPWALFEVTPDLAKGGPGGIEKDQKWPSFRPRLRSSFLIFKHFLA
jgi:hypothetical protein